MVERELLGERSDKYLNVANSNKNNKKIATDQQSTETGKGAGPRVCRVEGAGNTESLVEGGNKTTKTAIIQPLTHLLFCPRMVSKLSKLKKPVS